MSGSVFRSWFEELKRLVLWFEELKNLFPTANSSHWFEELTRLGPVPQLRPVPAGGPSPRLAEPSEHRCHLRVGRSRGHTRPCS